MLKIIGPRTPKLPDSEKSKIINTTSRSKGWSKGLSPFILGPVELYDGMISQTVESAWQFSKCYDLHTDQNENPSPMYFKWAEKGWADTRARRYPMGKGAIPLYSWWDDEKLSYIEARKRIYIPLYSKAVRHTGAFQTLKFMFDIGEDIYLWDFDGYDHKELGMTYTDVINCEDKKMGHAFILGMLLEGFLSC